MLTEDQARDLLQRAAATIEVATDAAPAPAAGRQRWGRAVLAAAVIAVLVATVGIAVLLRDDDDRAKAADPATPLAEVRIPSLLGYTRPEARVELERLGLRAEIVGEAGRYCSVLADPVLGTTPDPGTVVPAGSTVVLKGAGPGGPAAECEYGAGVGEVLLRFARGLGPAPVAPTGVTVRTDEGRVHLATAEARDPASWKVCRGQVCRSPLQALVERVDAVRGEALLTTGASRCPRRAGVVSVGVRDESDSGGCGILAVRLDGRDRITAVELTDLVREPTRTTAVPDVVGLDEFAAQAALERAGLLSAGSPGFCAGSPVVVTQRPPAGAQVRLGRPVDLAYQCG